MRILEKQLLWSASDLVGFAACGHLTQLELAATRGEIVRPTRDDPLLDVFVHRGEEHEVSVLHRYGAASVVTIAADTSTIAGIEAAAAETIAAMEAGAQVVYQATFLHDGWVGHADFVERVDAPSRLGDWSYEVADAKLARSVKAGAILQLCEYSAHVERIQGRAPRNIHVDTGDGARHTLRLADHAAYYRRLRAEFLDVTAGDPVATYPDPVGHCRVCRWAEVCQARRRADDHLSLVAGMRGDQTRKLHAAGIDTRRALAEAPAGSTCEGIGAVVHERLRAQAALQVAGEGCVPPRHELVEPDPDAADASTNDAGPRGLAALPLPSPGDLFLDLEGDPYALDGGLEYLFGIVEVVDGAPVFHPFWAHTRAEERAAFEAAVDFIVERRVRWPELHVYHYASYEPTAFKRLMGAHGTREQEIDDLLRHDVFVDLYRIVKQSVRLSTESYSLKQVETLYMQRPAGAVMDAGSSIVAYEDYLRDSDPARLDDIGAYNRDDCESLVGLRDWLEARRKEVEARDGPLARPSPPEVTTPPDDGHDELAAELLALDGPPEVNLLAELLGWHRREDKPEWWRYFARCHDYEPQEFVDDSECIGGIDLAGEEGTEKQSILYRLRFPPQEHKFSEGSKPDDPATGRGAGTIVEIGDDSFLLKRGNKSAGEPLPDALIPGQPIGYKGQKSALVDVASWVRDHGLDASGPYRAGRDLLLRRPPRVRTRARADRGGALRRDGEAVLDAARRIANDFDGGCLAIQGPPGAGKTYVGARVVADLIHAGNRVGITATTHSAIGNLLEMIAVACGEIGVELRAIQKADPGKGCDVDGVECVKDAAVVEAALTTGACALGAGTAWLWCREGLRAALDVLVIDEAGQMSLADVLAVSTSARNLILLGDPQQLAQPSTGSHPDGAGASALEHLLDGRATIPADVGLFLDTTWRMHPSVCAFVSEVAYDGRLVSEAGRAHQAVDGDAGIWWVPVDHDGDRTRAPAEADAVLGLIKELLGTPWQQTDGTERPLALDDLIVVAPYNAHVAELRSRLPDGVPVGTVDKFQGREGAVAIYSMASSSVDDAPRGMNFLYDLHRLNVAVSRARARAYIVASPALLRVLCHTPEQLKLANALCRYVEVAAEQRLV